MRTGSSHGVEEYAGFYPWLVRLGAASRGNPYARKVIRDARRSWWTSPREIIAGIKEIEFGMALARARWGRDPRLRMTLSKGSAISVC